MLQKLPILQKLTVGIWNNRGVVQMGEKSLQKKKYIIETATRVFEGKGYLKVTMKDVVDACGISRGGLYLYYDNIRDLFLDVLQAQEDASGDVYAPSIPQESSAADLLGLFLSEQKKEILKGRHSLSIAVYEYYFETEMPKKENAYRNRFLMAVKVIEKLIRSGVKEGDFCCADPLGTARNMMYAMEGLKIASVTMQLTEEDLNREILYLLKAIVAGGDT